MSFNSIKNKVVPAAKRTASAANQLMAALPNLPPEVGMAGQIVAAILVTMPLKQALANPRPYLLAAGATTAAVAFLGGPAGLAGLLAMGAGIVVTYAVLAAVIFVLLAAITVYNERVKVTKAVVVLLDSL